MTHLSERSFHLLMTVLVLASTLLDKGMRAILPTWSPPQVGFVTFALGLIWIALFASYRMRNMHDRMRVAEDRLERAERKINDLEREAASRRL